MYAPFITQKTKNQKNVWHFFVRMIQFSCKKQTAILVSFLHRLIEVGEYKWQREIQTVLIKEKEQF